MSDHKYIIGDQIKFEGLFPKKECSVNTAYFTY